MYNSPAGHMIHILGFHPDQLRWCSLHSLNLGPLLWAGAAAFEMLMQRDPGLTNLGNICRSDLLRHIAEEIYTYIYIHMYVYITTCIYIIHTHIARAYISEVDVCNPSMTINPQLPHPKGPSTKGPKVKI